MSDTKNKYPFDALAESRGYSPEKLRGFTDNCKNVSHLLKGKGSEGKPIVIKIDLKKVKNKKQNEAGVQGLHNLLSLGANLDTND